MGVDIIEKVWLIQKEVVPLQKNYCFTMKMAEGDLCLNHSTTY